MVLKNIFDVSVGLEVAWEDLDSKSESGRNGPPHPPRKPSTDFGVRVSGLFSRVWCG